MRGNIWRAGDWLTLLWCSQRISLHLSVWEQALLQLNSHLPCSRHLSHKLADSDNKVDINKMPSGGDEASRRRLKIRSCTGTSTPTRAASSHSQQAMAVSMPCAVNILRGDQQRWCKSCGSHSGVHRRERQQLINKTNTLKHVCVETGTEEN